MTQPIRFIFGLHLHQPVGNFGSVFSQHLDEVYLPFLQKVDEREFFPLVLHISGPLLEWLESNGKGYLDMVSRLVDAGRLELLCAGMYEPVLASLPRQDRIEQIGWMREKLRKRFGIDARGLWLTERVWEPELAADLTRRIGTSLLTRYALPFELLALLLVVGLLAASYFARPED